jgi:hypothetical protein
MYNRYGQMFGSDDRLYACISELGVPLTKNPGFHQVRDKKLPSEAHPLSFSNVFGTTQQA